MAQYKLIRKSHQAHINALATTLKHTKTFRLT